MAVAITSYPGTNPRAAKQPLIFTLYDSVDTPDRFVVQVFEGTTYGLPGTNDGTEIAKLYLTPNSGGRAHFDLSDVVGDRVESCLSVGSMAGAISVFTATTAPSLSQEYVLKKYTVKVGRYSGGIETLDDDRDQVNLFNGTAQLSQGLNPSFAEFYPTAASKQVWMTDNVFGSKRTVVYMADEDEAVIQAMKTGFLGGPSDTANTVRYKAYNSAGTLLAELSYSLSLSLTLKDNVYQIPAGPGNLDSMFTGGLPSGWDYIDIQIQQTTTARGKVYRVKKDCRPIKHDPVQLAWVNTLGAWDFARFDGRSLKTTSSESKTYRKVAGTYDANSFTFKTWERQTTEYHKTAKETYNLRNLYFTAEERELLQYCFRSKLVMYRIGTGDWLPCTVMTNTYVTQPAASQMFEVSFDIELAQDIRC